MMHYTISSHLISFHVSPYWVFQSVCVYGMFLFFNKHGSFETHFIHVDEKFALSHDIDFIATELSMKPGGFSLANEISAISTCLFSLVD